MLQIFVFIESGHVTCMGLEAPPIIKNFIWRMLRNFLPTRAHLRNKGVQCPPSCLQCEHQANSRGICNTGIGKLWKLFDFKHNILMICSSSITFTYRLPSNGFENSQRNSRRFSLSSWMQSNKEVYQRGLACYVAVFRIWIEKQEKGNFCFTWMEIWQHINFSFIFKWKIISG